MAGTRVPARHRGPERGGEDFTGARSGGRPRRRRVRTLRHDAAAAAGSEKHDVDYHFVDERGFQRLVDTGALLEHAQVHGHLYGTLRRGVEQALGSNQTVVLDIDVQGARMVRASLRRAVLVFVLPPSVSEMQRRLVSRGGAEDPIELRRRMMTARAELEAIREFDYVVINDDFDEAIRRFNAILAAERSRVYRWADVEAMVTTFRTDIDRFLERST